MKSLAFIPAVFILTLLVYAQSSTQSQPPSQPPKQPTTPQPSPITQSADPTVANPDERPLGDIARQKRAGDATKAKVVLDEESVKTKRIIPDIFSDGIDNSDKIIQAIKDYRATHSDAETERVIHDWYNDWDDQLRQAIEENKRIENALPPRTESEAEYQHEVENRRQDLLKRKENNLLSARIQQTFTRVRNALQTMGVKYEWLKIRCGNGNCSF